MGYVSWPARKVTGVRGKAPVLKVTHYIAEFHPAPEALFISANKKCPKARTPEKISLRDGRPY